jgi:pyruvate/2-oxoacid:ferredoxin oxidoreductase beta subunit
MSKIYNLKREVEKPPRLTGGHRLCAGCGAGVVVSGVLRALNQEDRAVVVNATSCLEVSTFMYPSTASSSRAEGGQLIQRSAPEAFRSAWPRPASLAPEAQFTFCSAIYIASASANNAE